MTPVAMSAVPSLVRVLIGPSERDIGTPSWSPDGTRLAVEVGPEYVAARGRRHAWPKRVARDYGMTRAADAAARRVILHASRALRRGASRETVLNDVRREYARVERRFREAGRNPGLQAVATELDRWLRAAGFPPTEGAIEIVC